MEEVWKDVVGYENYYEVSNTGYIRNKNTQRILKGNVNKDGYRKVKLGYGTSKEYCYHRVVAQAFIPNPDNKPEINHIDNDRLNNSADNLEWVTHTENVHWANKQGRTKRTEEWLKNERNGNRKKMRPIIGIDEQGVEHYYECVSDVRKAGFANYYVSLCCKGRKDKYKGWTWKYANNACYPLLSNELTDEEYYIRREEQKKTAR